MIRVTAKVTRTGVGLDGILRAFEDQQQLNRDAIEAAEPVLAAARANIRKKTGKTHDQITAWANEEAPMGSFGIFVGIPGPAILGSASRHWIGRLLEEGKRLEFGSSKRRAFPWLRPAKDQAGPQLMRRFAEITRRRIGR